MLPDDDNIILKKLKEAWGDLPTARKTMQQELAEFEAEKEPDWKRIARRYSNLAICETAMGLREEANANYKKGLAIEERVYGPNHPEVASTLVTIAMSEWSLKRIAPARDAMFRALKIRESQFPRDKKALSSIKGFLGLLLQTTGEFERARQYLKEAADLSESSPFVREESKQFHRETFNRADQLAKKARKRHEEN